MTSSSESFMTHLANVQAKKRKRSELTCHLTAIKEVAIHDVDPTQMESVLCVKHGFDVTAQLQLALKSVPPILSILDRKALLDVAFKGLGLQYSVEEQNMIVRGLVKENVTTHKEEFLFLCPVAKCVKCNTRLLCHNKPSEVTVYTLNGPTKALSICWRCEKCDVNYNYCRFGNTSDSYQFYEVERPYIQSTNCTLIDRQLCRFQIFLALVVPLHNVW